MVVVVVVAADDDVVVGADDGNTPSVHRGIYPSVAMPSRPHRQTHLVDVHFGAPFSRVNILLLFSHGKRTGIRSGGRKDSGCRPACPSCVPVVGLDQILDTEKPETEPTQAERHGKEKNA